MLGVRDRAGAASGASRASRRAERAPLQAALRRGRIRGAAPNTLAPTTRTGPSSLTFTTFGYPAAHAASFIVSRDWLSQLTTLAPSVRTGHAPTIEAGTLIAAVGLPSHPAAIVTATPAADRRGRPSFPTPPKRPGRADTNVRVVAGSRPYPKAAAIRERTRKAGTGARRRDRPRRLRASARFRGRMSCRSAAQPLLADARASGLKSVTWSS